MSVSNVKKWQSSGELIWALAFQGPLPKVGTDSPKGPLPSPGSSLCLITNSVGDEREQNCVPTPGSHLVVPLQPKSEGWK